jgi:hypothetical protein
METDLTALATALTALGCPAERSREMAEHLDRRARQLAETKGRTYDEAMVHLLRMMAGGWAAKGDPGPGTQ